MNSKRTSYIALACLALVACTTAPSSVQGNASIQDESQAVLSRGRELDPQLAESLRTAVGYAVFPTIAKAGAGVGGAYGKGVLYERGRIVGYCDMTQATIGLQLGGQSYSEIVCFADTAALTHFKSGDLALDAQASGVVLESGSGVHANDVRGVQVYTLDEAGLMAEASVGGQRFTYVPMS